MSVATTFDERVPELPRGVLALFAAMTPTRGGGEIDASRLKFSLRLVIQIACAFLGGLAAMYTATSGMRSDLRDMRTMLTMQAEIDKVRQTLMDERAMTMKSDVLAMKAQQQVTNYDVQAIKTDIAILKSQGEKK